MNAIRRLARPVLAFALLSLQAGGTRADEPALALADLADYHAALIDRNVGPPPRPVTYRALWDHPGTFRGKRVLVEGRIVRRFRQGAYGTFPPLVEVWAVTPAGEPFCWVFPEPKDGAPSPKASATSTPSAHPVRFAGTFLRRIRYQGADVARLAPLIVGPRPPIEPAAPRVPAHGESTGFSWVEWCLGTGAAVVVALVLVWQHVRGPVSRTRLLEGGTDPRLEPSFEDGSADEGTVQRNLLEEE